MEAIENSLEEKKKECKEYLDKANLYKKQNSLDLSLKMLQNAVLVAEKIYHLTKTTNDFNSLYDIYLMTAKHLHIIYNVTKQYSDLLQSVKYYEKILFLCEDPREVSIENRKKAMEAYLQILFISIECSDYNLFGRFLKRAKQLAKSLYHMNKCYEYEQYIIIIMMFEGNYYYDNTAYWKALIKYFLASRRLEKIYNSYPQKEILYDLKDFYERIITTLDKLNKEKLMNKWNNKVIKIERILADESKVQ